MKITKIILVFLFIPLILFSEDLSLSNIIPLVLKHDISVQIAERNLDISQNGKKLLIAEILPQIKTSPLYTFSKLKTQNFLSGNEEDQLIQGISGEIGLLQALPTEGILSFSISNSMGITVQEEETSITQSPSMSISLNQPLFVNGKIINFSIYPARRRLYGTLPVSNAEVQMKGIKNSSLVAAFSGYCNTLGLRNRLIQMNKSIELTEKRLEQTKIRQKQGSVTETEMWEMEIDLEKIKENQLELKYSLLQSEQILARSLGLEEDLCEKTLSADIPDINIAGTEKEILDRVLSANPDILKNILSLEQSRLQGIVNGSAYKTNLSLSFSLEPKYALDRESSDSIGDSFNDFFDENAYIVPQLSIGLSVPVYNGGKKKIQKRIDEDRLFIVQAGLESVKKTLQDNLKGLLLRRSMLSEKLELTAKNLMLEEKRLEDKERLLALKTITTLDVEQVRLKRDEKMLELWQTKADLFLNSMEILSLAGEDLQKILQGS